MMTLMVRVQPRARRDEIVGERGGSLVVRLTAPPLDDKANQALRKLIAKRLGVSLSSVVIARGERSRDKVVEVQGLSDQAVRRRLGLDVAG